MKVGVLASGAGTNLQAILDRVHGRGGVEVVGVGSDKPDAQALGRAETAGVETAVFERPPRRTSTARVRPTSGCAAATVSRIASSRSATSPAATGRCASWRGPAERARFAGQVINVHPALLPAFPGIRAVEQALDYGVKVFGVTVHFVDEGVDTGPIILQRAVELPLATEPEEVREALRPIEHDLLCEAVGLIARGAVRLDPGHPRRVLVAP